MHQIIHSNWWQRKGRGGGGEGGNSFDCCSEKLYYITLVLRSHEEALLMKVHAPPFPVDKCDSPQD